MESGIRKHHNHHWKFFRVGGVDQVDLRTGADITSIEQLDQKLWVALACPVESVEFDRRTLELLDTDKDGRIRAPEIIAVTRWVKEVFKNPDDLVRASETVMLSVINTETEAGRALVATAQRVLATLGKEHATEITLADVSDTAKIFASTDFNGDGIVPASSAMDSDTQKVIDEIIATQGALTDRSGKPGIDQLRLETFLAQALQLLGWQNTGEGDPAISPLGPATAQAAARLEVVRNKVEDYFTRCQLADFDPRYKAILNGGETEFAPAAARELAPGAEAIARLPLARIEPGRPLSLLHELNPAWAEAIEKFRNDTVIPFLGERSELTETEWARILSALAPFQAWHAAKPISPVEALGIGRIREIIAAKTGEKISSLIERDIAFGIAAEQITDLEKLVRVQRDLFRLLNNFVSFSEFYAGRGAVFQAGTLYLDSRSCDLCVHVTDSSRHGALAGLAKAYLAYCDCTRLGVRRTIAAAFTAGDSDHLMIGRNGVFYDRAGQDWDATIVKIIDNPISIHQAFLSPYKKLIRLVEEQVAKRAAAADAAADAALGTAAARLAQLTPPDPKAPKKVDVGTVAAIGVALGSLGTFLALVFTKFIDLGWWAPLALVALVLGISGPSMFIAFLKLRQRNLGPILDANGWAVNGRMKINVPFGAALSKRAKLPPGAERRLTDPFHETHAIRNIVVALLVLAVFLPLCWRLHLFDRFLPPDLQPHRPVQVVPATEAKTTTTP